MQKKINLSNQKNTNYSPMRTCIGCGKKTEKVNLIRFVALDNTLIFDVKKKLPGRGVSLCFDKNCIQSAIKKNKFNTNLKTNLEKQNLEDIVKLISDNYSNYLYTIMRFAFGGKKIIEGLDICVNNIKNNKIHLCLITNDISENSLKKILPVLKKYNIKYKFIDNKKEVAMKLHRPIRTVYGINDEILCKNILQIITKIEKVKTWIG